MDDYNGSFTALKNPDVMCGRTSTSVRNCF
jgi:hypothetical protein